METVQNKIHYIEKALHNADKLGYNIWNNPKRKTPININYCEYCGKKCVEKPLYVHITTNGTCVPNDIDENDLNLTNSHSQGCFQIGSSCAKKLFKNKEEIRKYTF